MLLHVGVGDYIVLRKEARHDLCRRNIIQNPKSTVKFYIFVTLSSSTVYPKKYAHGFCFAVLCCGYTLTDFPISIRLTSLALWQSNDCPSASKATLMNMDKYLMWIHYERLHNHNKAKHNKTVCIFFGIYCITMHGRYQKFPITIQGVLHKHIKDYIFLHLLFQLMQWWHFQEHWLAWKCNRLYGFTA